MSDEKNLRPATTDELVQSLFHALRFDGKKRVHQGDEFIASLMAKHLAEHLEPSSFVILKKPPPSAPA